MRDRDRGKGEKEGEKTRFRQRIWVGLEGMETLEERVELAKTSCSKCSLFTQSNTLPLNT